MSRLLKTGIAHEAAPPRGFSVLELLIVVFIVLVIAAMTVPAMTSVIAGYKLDAAGHATASLLQQARLQAVRNNVPAYVQPDATNPSRVYVTGDPIQPFTTGNPDVEISGIVFATNNLPDATQLTPLVTNGNGGVAVQTSGAIGFNARGLPCLEQSSAVLCWQQDSKGNTPAFEWFLQGANGGWEAVTVSPAGRIKAWRMASSTGCGAPGSSTTTSPCWQ